MLHLLYEDLKLNKFRLANECKRLAKVLIDMALSVDPYKKAANVEYYIKENSHWINKEEIEAKMKKAYKDSHAFKEGVEVEPVPKIMKWLNECLNGEHG